MSTYIKYSAFSLTLIFSSACGTSVPQAEPKAITPTPVQNINKPKTIEEMNEEELNIEILKLPVLELLSIAEGKILNKGDNQKFIDEFKAEKDLDEKRKIFKFFNDLSILYNIFKKSSFEQTSENTSLLGNLFNSNSNLSPLKLMEVLSEIGNRNFNIDLSKGKYLGESVTSSTTKPKLNTILLKRVLSNANSVYIIKVKSLTNDIIKEEIDKIKTKGKTNIKFDESHIICGNEIYTVKESDYAYNEANLLELKDETIKVEAIKI